MIAELNSGITQSITSLLVAVIINGTSIAAGTTQLYDLHTGPILLSIDPAASLIEDSTVKGMLNAV